MTYTKPGGMSFLLTVKLAWVIYHLHWIPFSFYHVKIIRGDTQTIKRAIFLWVYCGPILVCKSFCLIDIFVFKSSNFTMTRLLGIILVFFNFYIFTIYLFFFLAMLYWFVLNKIRDYFTILPTHDDEKKESCFFFQ